MKDESTFDQKRSLKSNNSIPLATAQNWTKRWRDKESSYNKYHELNAFLIPSKDLAEVLAEDGSDYVRAYIGVEKMVSNIKGEKPTYIEKLMFVATKFNPVTGIYEDMITDKLVNGTNNEDGIYDFSKPCPPNGDPTSPLNQ